ncbi:hypothetical protein [Pedobacter psychroterrae]|nr:hypothetical protein [Pedobacter psychroterrae]
MNDLLQLAVDAHGGMKRWNELSEAFVTMKIGGVLWESKQVPGFASIGRIRAKLHEQIYFNEPFLKEGQRSHFQNGTIAIETPDGSVIKERTHPREAFKGHTMETPWDDLHLAYFNAYATWTYLTLPFVLTYEGFQVEEVEGRMDNGEKCRVLKATFPDYLAYHSKEQKFYFGPNGLLRRLDYDVEVSKGASGAHYVHDYQEFNGIMVPTKRLVYPPDENNDPIKDLLVVSAELTEVSFK